MSARTGQRVQRGTAAGLLRAAAGELFAERGYYRTATREIAERAGVSPDLIYRYFGTKEKLFYDAVLDPFLDALGHEYREWLSAPEPDNESPEDLIAGFAADFSAFMQRNQAIARAMIHIFIEQAPSDELDFVRHKIAESIAPMVITVESYLAAHGHGQGDVALKVRMTMALIGAVVLFVPRTYDTDADVPPRQTLIDGLVQFILYGYNWH